MRQPMNSLGPRLIAAGLIRDEGQRAAVQLHVAATLISEQGVAAGELPVALGSLWQRCRRGRSGPSVIWPAPTERTRNR